MATPATQGDWRALIFHVPFFEFWSGSWQNSLRIWCSLCVWCQTMARKFCLWSRLCLTARDRNSWGSRTSLPRSARQQTLVCPSIFVRTLTVRCVSPDLWYSEGSFHRSGWWSNTEAGGSGRPALCSLQVHAETLLQGPAPLTTRLPQEPGRFPVSVNGLTLSVDLHHWTALWTTWWYLSFWHLSGSLILISLIRWNNGSNADWGLLLSKIPMDYDKTLPPSCCIIWMVTEAGAQTNPLLCGKRCPPFIRPLNKVLWTLTF